MDESTLRAWWAHRQGLTGEAAGSSAAEILAATGWARSVGGAAPYIGLFARASLGRQVIDDALANQQIHELPSARGCTYVVPRQDYALALAVGRGFADGDMSAARKLGVTDKEIDKLCRLVVDALEGGPLDPEQLKAALGAAVRNLGEAGKKKGIITTLPLALGRLQAEGDIRRIPTNGRLDQQRYRYARWVPSPLAGYAVSPAEAATELARRYFAWIAPASLTEFQWFSGFSAKAAAAAVAPLNLEPLAAGDARLLPASLRASLQAFRRPSHPHYTLISSLDSVLLLRRNVNDHFDAADRELKLPTGGAAAAASGLKDLPSPAILDRGRIVGLWEYDPESASIAWMSISRPDTALREAIARTEQFIRGDLGDARTYSLDSPKSRQPRIQALRTATAG